MEDYLVAHGVGPALAKIVTFEGAWEITGYILGRPWASEEKRAYALAKSAYRLTALCTHSAQAQLILTLPLADLPEITFEEACCVASCEYGGVLIPNLRGVDFNALLRATLTYCSPGSFEAILINSSWSEAPRVIDSILADLMSQASENRDWTEEKCIIALEMGADPRRADARGRNALHWASFAKFPQFLEQILATGLVQADSRALFFASAWHSQGGFSRECIELLVQAGAPLAETDRDGLTPYQVATRANNPHASLLNSAVYNKNAIFGALAH